MLRLIVSSLLVLVLTSCTQDEKLFTPLSSSVTNIQFENTLEHKPRLNILYYLYYYNGGGVATGDVNGDGLADIYFTANSKGNNKLYINKGNFEFEDVTDAAGVAGDADWCSGVTMADVNGDGLLDIYVSAVSGAYQLEGHNLLYINNGEVNGTLTFTESAAAYGLDFKGLSTQAAFFDYDHDGDLDCYLLNHSQQPHANIVDTSNRRKKSPIAGDILYRNDMNTSAGKFIDVSASAGIYQSNLGYGLGLAVADFNNDGWEDIYIGNDFHENDYYYVNNGDGTFSENGAKHFNHYSRFSMGNDAADFNNDGQVDLITVDMLPADEKILKTYGSDENADIYKVKLQMNGYQHQYSKNVLHRNNGGGSSFSDVSLLSGVSATDWSWGPLFADFDNDGNKDLFISSGIVKRPVDLDYIRFISDLQIRKGMDKTNQYDDEALDKMPDGAMHPFLFKGDGRSQFEPMSEEWGTAKLRGYFNGASYADLNNDGAMDLVINSINAQAVILKNNQKNKKHITFHLQGQGLNTAGIGAKVYLFQKGRLQYQHLMPTRGFQSASDTRLHFGLDTLTVVDSVLVVWPDQRYQVIKNVAANKQLSVKQADAAGIFSYSAFFPAEKSLLVAHQVNSAWKHMEDPFNDFNTQYLIPHALSTRGPKIAVGDINEDGFDDMYLCGAHGQPGTLLMQDKNGSFTPAQQQLFDADKYSEDVDAVFFDANGDGRLDLYVVTGGNVLHGADPLLKDKLYINDGTGRFVKSELPDFYGNKSCVTTADIDADGDTDLFIGTLADATSYGAAQTSHLLINNGKGVFSIAPASVINLEKVGMVTCASFNDFNNDGKPDLVIAGEWMPITLFINTHGVFKKTELPNTNGWWQTVFADDVNGDGNLDILAGNWGWNNKFSSQKNSTVKLYVSDFDKNGKTDHLLSYTIQGKEYPFLAKDEAERSLPVLRKHYLHYAEFAGLEMKDAYYGFAETVQPLIAERLGSALCTGDGKGGFTIQDLPVEVQAAPVYAFQKVSSTGDGNTYMAGGNFYDVIPYEGRYDAQPLSLFTVNKQAAAKYLHQTNLLDVKGQIRDLKWVSSIHAKPQLFVACNNDKLISFKLQ